MFFVYSSLSVSIDCLVTSFGLLYKILFLFFIDWFIWIIEFA